MNCWLSEGLEQLRTAQNLLNLHSCDFVWHFRLDTAWTTKTCMLAVGHATLNNTLEPPWMFAAFCVRGTFRMHGFIPSRTKLWLIVEAEIDHHHPSSNQSVLVYLSLSPIRSNFISGSGILMCFQLMPSLLDITPSLKDQQTYLTCFRNRTHGCWANDLGLQRLHFVMQKVNAALQPACGEKGKKTAEFLGAQCSYCKIKETSVPWGLGTNSNTELGTTLVRLRITQPGLKKAAGNLRQLCRGQTVFNQPIAATFNKFIQFADLRKLYENVWNMYMEVMEVA